MKDASRIGILLQAIMSKHHNQPESSRDEPGKQKLPRSPAPTGLEQLQTQELFLFGFEILFADDAAIPQVGKLLQFIQV